MRATSQDSKMALLLGININTVISVTFLIGSAAAAIGGVLISSQMGQINFYIGFIVGIKAFVAAVLGGIGSIAGAVLGNTELMGRVKVMRTSLGNQTSPNTAWLLMRSLETLKLRMQ